MATFISIDMQKESSPSMRDEVHEGLIGVLLSSVALLLRSSSPFSSEVKCTIVSARSLGLGIPGPNSGLFSSPALSPSFLSAADRLPYQNVNTLSARKKSTPIVTPTPIPTLALVDRPLCFSVLGGVVLCCGLSEFGLDVLELGLGALELGLDVLGFGVDVLEFGFGVLEFGVDEGEFGMEVLEFGFDVPVAVWAPIGSISDR
ncbi:hypothetical protein BGZ57DRAFT_1004380 [Hyaloscypha finlandica]|nr:hypothetical protein BGZ57DRAFT_1004380 [Hyaloscypha finlandica]